MNQRKYQPPTDEEILAMDRVPAVIAARYLGMTYSMLTYKLQQGKMPFGLAEKRGKWVYYINPKKLYSYKNDIPITDDTNVNLLISEIETRLDLLKTMII